MHIVLACLMWLLLRKLGQAVELLSCEPPLGQKQVKVKCTLVQALRLCTGCTAHRGRIGIALLFHDHGTRRGWGVSVTPRPLFTSGKDPVPIVQEAGWTPVPVWTGAENLAPTGIRSPDRLARSQSLYRLRYPPHCYVLNIRNKRSVNLISITEVSDCNIAIE